MKRSAALAPLSRDHHTALVVARDLSRATEDDAQTAADRFVRFLTHHELAHFALEERLLPPVIPDEPRGRALQAQMLSDHEHLRAALLRLRESGETADVGFLRDLGARLRAHVQLEEQQLFPYIERSLDEPALAALGQRVERAHQAEAAGDPE